MTAVFPSGDSWWALDTAMMIHDNDERRRRDGERDEAVNDDTAVQAAPHPFVRLRRWANRGRCRHCFLHERHHPIRWWVAARPVGDLTPAVDPDDR